MTTARSVFCLLIIVLIHAHSTIAEGRNGHESTGNKTWTVLEKLLESYDGRLRPQDGGPPVHVNVSMLINRIISVCDSSMEITVDAYLRLAWEDPRLDIPEIRNRTRLIGAAAMVIWTPDIFVANEINSYIHSTTVVNEVFNLHPNGRLYRATRYTLTLACPMDLTLFPMDTQKCGIHLESYGYSARDVKLAWYPSTNITKEQGLLSNFQVRGLELDVKESMTEEGAHFCKLELKIKLIRAVGYYIMQVYLPATLLVIVSWFSLWLNSFVAERIALGLTTVLTMTTLLSSMNATAPKIPYIKAMDVYMGICFSFVFASLLQSVAVAHRSMVRRDSTKGKKDPRDSSVSSGGVASKIWVTPAFLSGFAPEMTKQPSSGQTDQLARTAFPSAFILVNVIYWGYYLHASASA